MRGSVRLVSIVIPALNEERYIGACLRSILEQRFDGEHEVIVVDQRSADATAAIARGGGATVVANPGNGIPSALNAGLRVASGSVLVRFDAHAEMPSGYVEACLRALDEESGAVNVGGWREARGLGPWGAATGTALASPFGVGNARIWRRPRDGATREDVDTVPLGAFPVAALRDVGGWDATLLANEDFELNHRLRSAGGRVVFDPAIWSIYRPRETLGALAQQYWRYGNWKSVVLARSPESLRPRQLAPLAVVGTTAVALVPGGAGRAARAALVGYAAVVGAVAVRAGDWRVAPVLTTMHLAWGAGVACGLVANMRRR